MPKGDKAYIAGGHVYCRIQRKDMDVDQCLGCTRLRELNDKASPPFVVCESPTAPIDALYEPGFMEWWHQHHRPTR